jgi:hypothetical protein
VSDSFDLRRFADGQEPAVVVLVTARLPVRWPRLKSPEPIHIGTTIDADLRLSEPADEFNYRREFATRRRDLPRH